MNKSNLTLQRSFSQLALAGLMLAMLSSICGPCIAAVHHSTAPVQDTSPDCHPTDDDPQPQPDSCDCPAWMADRAVSIDAAVASERAGNADEQPLHHVFVSSARRTVLAGSLPPGRRADIPRVSPLRSFCIQLE